VICTVTHADGGALPEEAEAEEERRWGGGAGAVRERRREEGAAFGAEGSRGDSSERCRKRSPDGSLSRQSGTGVLRDAAQRRVVAGGPLAEAFGLGRFRQQGFAGVARGSGGVLPGSQAATPT
jgi:hypothetical protein